GIAAEVFHFVLFGEEDFPLQQIDRHIHFRKRKIGAAFFRERRARVHEHKRNDVGVDGAEARAQQRNAIAVRTLHRFHFFSGNFGRENARTLRQSYLQEWLGLIFYGEFDFGQRSPFRSYERGDDSAFSDGGEHTAVRKARPFERERRFFVRLLVVTKCCLHGKSRERTKVRIHFFEI